jgi:hypothetical protein
VKDGEGEQRVEKELKSAIEEGGRMGCTNGFETIEMA